MSYHYTLCGLDNIYLTNGVDEHQTEYGDGVSIQNADDLDTAIALAVISLPYRLQGQDLRFLRSLLDLSQKELADRLGTQRVTIARWEGKPYTPITGSADRLLRFYCSERLFAGACSAALTDLLPEIDEGKRPRIEMGHVKSGVNAISSNKKFHWEARRTA
ncbi:MAG: helix-turn-helix domain-containing protein [Magnetovibrionaceae bacterium]